MIRITKVEGTDTLNLIVMGEDGGHLTGNLTLELARKVRDELHRVLQEEAVKQAHAFYDFPDLHLQFTDNKAEWPDDEGMWGPGRMFTLSGCLPDEYPSHYDVEDELKNAGKADGLILDSESGCLFIYADTKERLTEAVEFIRPLARR